MPSPIQDPAAPAGRRPRRPGAAAVLMLAFAAGLLGFVIWAFFRLWALAGPAEMSVHGYIAMGLAAVFTLGLGGGLMWLAFYSSRNGYDERVGEE